MCFRSRVSGARLLAAFLIFALLFSLFGCASRTYRTARLYKMGTYCSFTLAGSSAEDGDAMSVLAPLVGETEALLSHRMTGSFPERLLAEGTLTVTDERLLSALRLADSLFARTGGLFSVSVLPITSLWNFDAEDPAPPAAEAIAEALAACGTLTVAGDVVTLSSGGIDLGAMGKGYAADVCADALRERGESGLVAIGGSIAAVGKKEGAPWQIGVRNPMSASQNDTLGTLALTDTFVSTSGSYEKTFTYEGVSYHHILDPRTGMPAESDLLSVTVVGESGVLTDALSTACFLLGLEGAFALAAEYGASILAVTAEGALYVSASLADRFSVGTGWEAIYR